MNRYLVSLVLIITACLIMILNLDFDYLSSWKINGKTYVYILSFVIMLGAVILNKLFKQPQNNEK